jgi:hypothetical protein
MSAFGGKADITAAIGKIARHLQQKLKGQGDGESLGPINRAVLGGSMRSKNNGISRRIRFARYTE